jgi:hypothetical protein
MEASRPFLGKVHPLVKSLGAADMLRYHIPRYGILRVKLLPKRIESVPQEILGER